MLTSSAVGRALAGRFAYAVGYAAQCHTADVHHGDTPFLGHLLGVASLVIQAGGTETQATAAILKDVAAREGAEGIAEIRRRFGDDVGDVVQRLVELWPWGAPPSLPWEPDEDDREVIADALRRSELAALIVLCERIHDAEAALGAATPPATSTVDRDGLDRAAAYFDGLATCCERAAGMPEALRHRLGSLAARLTALSVQSDSSET
jgi:(p)ppGpp synthase/HD superfamily hydrolase